MSGQQARSWDVKIDRAGEKYDTWSMYPEGAKSEARLHGIFSPSKGLGRLCDGAGLTLTPEYCILYSTAKAVGDGDYFVFLLPSNRDEHRLGKLDR